MKRRRFLVGSLIASAFVLSSIAIAGLRPGASIINSETPSYELTLSSFADASSKATDLGNPISFYKSGLTSAGAGKVGQLSTGGYIYNSTKISGIKRIDVTLSSGSIKIHRASVAGGSDGFIVGTSYDLTTIYPNYFKIEAIETTVIDSIKVTYSCVDYQKESEDLGYSLYVNGIKSDAIFTDATKQGEGYDKQYKITLDVYAGDVISFKKDNNEFQPTATPDSNNNVERTDSRGYLLVNSTCKGADLYLKKKGANYDAWLAGNGTSNPLPDLQDAPILQAWNWSLSSITSRLDDIKEAGFKAIQISPMQVHEASSSKAWYEVWRDLYRPWSLSVATSSSQSVIGTKTELKTLAAAAEAKGISLIMDVVLNHLDGYGYDSWYDADDAYEHEIVSKNYRHDAGVRQNDSPEDTLMKSLGNYPDLDTWQPHVQGRALSLLKEYLDCGVKGFRFDAAKHIETPKDDARFADSFWPYVVNGAKRYAAANGWDAPFFYGEAVGGIDGRYFSWYYPYMSITDGGQAYNIREGVTTGNLAKIQEDYHVVDPSSVSILWNESHDNYWENTTRDIGKVNINKVYAIQASRGWSSSLYLARPNESTKMGAVGNTDWMDEVVRGANAFANRYHWTDEYRTYNNGCFINRRGDKQDAGALIVNINNGSESFEVTVDGLWNGTYKDLVTGKDYNVYNGKVTLSFYNGVVALVPAVSHTYYVVGNDIFTGTSASWTAESGRQMTKVTGQNLAELKNVNIAKDAEVRIIKQYDDGTTPTEWFDTLGSSYTYVGKSGNNIIFNRTSTFSFYLNNEGNIYIVDEDPEPVGNRTVTITGVPTWWTNDNAKFYVWAWGGGAGGGTAYQAAYSNNTLTVTIPSDATGMKAARCKPEMSTFTWGDVWNETSNHTLSSKTSYTPESWG